MSATNSDGTSAFSSVASASTEAEPDPDPNPLSAPDAMASNITETGFTASWSAVDGAIAYQLDVATDDAFVSLVVDMEVVTDTSSADFKQHKTLCPIMFDDMFDMELIR